MFEKFKIRKYNVAGVPMWGISHRLCFFWYKPLIHKKYVMKDDSNHLQNGFPSREILTFSLKEIAKDEMDRLYFGLPPIVSRTWKNGKCIKEQYK